MMLEGENKQPKTAPPLIFSIDSRLSVHRVLAKMIAWWHLALLQTFMSPADKPVHLVITDKELFFLNYFKTKYNLTWQENICFRSTKPNVSSKIVGWLVGDWDGNISDLKKIWKKEKIFWNKSEKGESYIFAYHCDNTLKGYLIWSMPSLAYHIA